MNGEFVESLRPNYNTMSNNTDSEKKKNGFTPRPRIKDSDSDSEKTDLGGEYGGNEAAKEAFTDATPYLEDKADLLNDMASEGDAAAAEKLIAGDSAGESRLAKALKDGPEDVPQWALALAAAIEQNTKAIEASQKEHTGPAFTL